MLASTLPGLQFEKFEMSAQDSIQMHGSRASKSPMDVFSLGTLGERNKWGKRVLVLIMIRDPRDIVTSKHPVLPDRYFIGYDHSWWPGPKGSSEWKYDAQGIGEIHQAICRARTNTEFHVMLLRYELLVANPDRVQAEIASLFGIKFCGKFSRFYEKAHALPYRYEGRFEAKDATLVREDKTVDPSRAGKWRHDQHRDRIAEQFTQFPALLDLVREYGYETSDAWFREYTT